MKRELQLVKENDPKSLVRRLTLLIYNSEGKPAYTEELIRNDPDFDAIASKQQYSPRQRETVIKLLIAKAYSIRKVRDFEYVQNEVEKTIRRYSPPLPKKT